MLKRDLLLIIIITIVVQFIFLLPIFKNINRAFLPIDDASRYERLALNIIEHHTYSRDSVPPYQPESFVPPGYPVFISVIYSISGKNPVFVFIIQIVFSCLIGWLTYLLTIKFIENKKLAFISGVLVGLSPNLAFHTTKLISESLFTFLLLLSLYLLFVAIKNAKTKYLLIAGFTFGLTTYVRTIAIYFPILVFIILIVQRKKFSIRLLNIIGFILIYLSTLVPWIIRNTKVFNRPIFATTAEWNIAVYNAPTLIASQKRISISEARDSIWVEVQKIVRKNPQFDTTNNAISAQLAAKVGLQYIFRAPITYMKIQTTSFLFNFIIPIGISPLIKYVTGRPLSDLKIKPGVAQEVLAQLVRGRIHQAITLVITERFQRLSGVGLLILLWATIFQMFIMIGVVISLIINIKRIFYLLIPIIYFTLATGPVCDARFRVPVEPLLIIIATIGYFSTSQRNANNEVF